MEPHFPFISRRRFLHQISGGVGGLALQGILGRQASAASGHGGAIQIDPIRPFLPRQPHFPAKARSVIFLYMVGAPSSIDTFDYKPTLQKLAGQKVPTSFRDALKRSRHSNVFEGCKDELMGSPFKFSQHGQSGMWVSELYPKLAERVDDLCFIHSMQADSNNHAPASYQMHTGETASGKASLGSWVTYGLGTENQSLPGYVLLFDAGPLGGAANYANGFLPAAFQGTRLRAEGMPVLDLLPPSEFAGGQRATLDLLQDLNLQHRAARPGLTELDARIASYELAFQMQASALDVGDLEKEPLSVRESYGLGHQDKQLARYGRKCLMARRLVERGVRFVQIYNMYDKDGWDAHSHLAKNHPPLARQTDQPIAALLDDLKQRGLLDETLVICASEFGRTPMMQGDQGRQHNAAGFTVWMAGGGVKPGVRIGATDEIGLLAVDQPHGLQDLHATILAAMGLRHDEFSFDHNGRPERLTGVAGNAEIIPGVFG